MLSPQAEKKLDRTILTRRDRMKREEDRATEEQIRQALQRQSATDAAREEA